MKFNFPLLAAATAAALLVLPAPSRAQTFSDTQRGEIEKIIKDYLVTHPEVLEQASAELEKRKQEAEAEHAKTEIASHAQTLFYSPRQVTIGNTKGDVTLVEFFDYNCGYCKRALTDLTTIMKDDPKLRVVLKEFPVLGPGSVEAAQVAVAVRMQDKTGKKYLEFHQKLLGGRQAADKARALAVAKDVGMDMTQLQKDMQSAEVKATLEENFKLAEALGLNGTPSYVIGDQVVVGAVGLPTLKKDINGARCGKDEC